MMPPDAVIRERALATSESFLVQAPAGSGKTELLTQRFLALLGTVETPESIVAITFTRKATGEMRGRIAGALDRARGPEPAEAHQKRTWTLARAALQRNEELQWGLLENPGRLRIMTIDSLCASLNAQMPWMSRMGGHLAPAEDPEALHHEAALRTLAMLESDSPFRPLLERLLLHLDNNLPRAAELLMRMLGRRDQWLRHIAGGLDRERLEASLRAISTQALHRLRPRVPFAAWDLLRYAGRDVEDAEELERFLALADFLLTKDGSPRRKVTKNEGFPPGDPRKAEMEALCRRIDDEFAAELHAVRGLPPPAYTDRQWAIIEALAAVLQLGVAQLRLLFQERRTIDFVELTLSAIGALGTDEEPTPLAFALDFRLQHLLLDEFQDTSISKMLLLERLTADWTPGDGRTVFAVGDPMQSIYSFQEADVSLFERCRRQGLGRLPLEFLQLTANFRSSSNLIDWFNATFPGVMAAGENAATGAVPYSPSTAQKGPLDGEPVACHAVARDREPALVADLIERAEGKVAVLVRRRVDAHGIVAELKRRGVPFQAVEMDPLAERSIIQDLRALTRALLHPADRVAWLSVLRAPWCGLELAALEAIAGAEVIPDALRTLPSERLARVAEVLERALGERRRRSLRRQVEETWRALGGPACLRDEAEREDARTYFGLLDTLDEAGDLPDFAALDEALGRLNAAPDPLAPDRVQIMTMHKAKGLEFDNVILPGLANKARSGDGALLRWAELEDLVVGCVRETGGDHDRVYQYLGALERDKEYHEAGRLLYVAATRAKKRLHLVGGEAVKGSFLARLAHAVGDAFAAPPARPEEAPAAAVAPGVPLRRVPDGWTAPPAPAPLDWSVAADVFVEEEEPIAFDWSGQTLRDVGTVVHHVLQQIAQQGVEAWSEERVEDRRPAIRAQLQTVGVPRAELDGAVERTVAALRQTLGSERGRWVLAAHEEAVSEWELNGVFGDRILHRKLDRTFVAGGVRWIIDYKTGAHEGSGAEAFLDNERERYRGQLETYAELVSRLDGRPVRLGLYFPLMDGWREWAWEPAVSGARREESATGRAGD
jgi:ATP-dependent exoDNAse (exonuclease V) beta subunit